MKAFRRLMDGDIPPGSNGLNLNAVKKASKEYFILRTSWLYGEHGKNFVDTIIAKAKKYGCLRVVDDQVGSPTYTMDLARAIHKLINKIVQGQGSGVKGQGVERAAALHAIRRRGRKPRTLVRGGDPSHLAGDNGSPDAVLDHALDGQPGVLERASQPLHGVLQEAAGDQDAAGRQTAGEGGGQPLDSQAADVGDDEVQGASRAVAV